MSDKPAISVKASAHVERIRLPGILGKIARIAGVKVAIAIAEEWGGTRLYVPHRLVDDHKMIKVLGLDVAQMLCREIGGRRHDIPSAHPALRRYKARRLRARGFSFPAIARKLGITMGHARTMALDVVIDGASAADEVNDL